MSAGKIGFDAHAAYSHDDVALRGFQGFAHSRHMRGVAAAHSHVVEPCRQILHLGIVHAHNRIGVLGKQPVYAVVGTQQQPLHHKAVIVYAGGQYGVLLLVAAGGLAYLHKKVAVRYSAVKTLALLRRQIVEFVIYLGFYPFRIFLGRIAHTLRVTGMCGARHHF